MGCPGLKAARTQSHGMTEGMLGAAGSIDSLKRHTVGINNRRASRTAGEFVNNAWRLVGVHIDESEEDV